MIAPEPEPAGPLTRGRQAIAGPSNIPYACFRAARFSRSLVKLAPCLLCASLIFGLGYFLSNLFQFGKLGSKRFETLAQVGNATIHPASRHYGTLVNTTTASASGGLWLDAEAAFPHRIETRAADQNCGHLQFPRLQM